MTSSVNDPIFRPADILIPRVADMTAWSVVACDQFTSDREYWARAEARAGESPSALRLILPEIYLGEPDVARRIADLGGAAREYLRRGIFYEARDSFVLVRRTLASGKTRLGLIGALDLDAYEYERDGAPIRASEQTVPGRLPPRVKIRTASPLETPHLMALISDPERSVIEPLTARDLPRLYDFELMEGGGRVAGYRVSGEHADAALTALAALARQNGGGVTARMIVGDGNHSLAAAKVIWEELKPTLTAEARKTHPARFALCEVCNIFDPALEFLAIHRVVFGADTDALSDALRARVGGNGKYAVTLCARGGETKFYAADAPIGDIIAAVQDCVDDAVKADGTRVDYIHGDAAVRALAERPDTLGILLPAMDKADFFATVETRGMFPRKSFSIGEGLDKRYYLECRRIRNDDA